MGNTRWSLGWVALAAFALAGCGGGLAPVSGTVTLDGKPLANVSVNFSPVAGDSGNVGAGSYGKTDDQGRYTLQQVGTNKAGAVIGKHLVRVSKYDQPKDSDSGGKEHLPERYNTKTTLAFEVPAGGADNANFELKSDKK